MAKFDPFLSLDCAPTPSTLAQSKERKGSNFAIWQPYLKKGWKAAAWYHRTKSSPSGLLKKPPTSAPQKERPAMERERHIGTEASRWLHSAMLSPVQMAAMRCVPANADLDGKILNQSIINS